MKHYSVTTPEVISWLRLCRPGSVIGPQQNFLAEMQQRMHREGEAHRRRVGATNGSAPSAAPAADGTAGGMGLESLSVASGNGRAAASPNARPVAATAAGTASPTRCARRASSQA